MKKDMSEDTKTGRETPTDYVLFGEGWKTEMMKLPKEMIIEMFKNAKLKKTKFVQTEEEK